MRPLRVMRAMIAFVARLRLWTALAAAFAFNLRPFGLSMKTWCAPGFNCHGCPAASTACPIGVLAFSSAVRAWPAAAIGWLLVIGAAVGRLMCGYACPVGLAQECMHRVPGPKLRAPRWLRYGKYLVLALLVAVLPFALGFHVEGLLVLDKPRVDKAAEGLSVVVPVRNPTTEPVRGVDLVATWRGADGTELEAIPQRLDLTVPPGGRMDLPAFTVPNRLEEGELLVTSPQASVRQEPPLYAYVCSVCPVGTAEASIPNGTWTGAWLARTWPRLVILTGVLVACWLVSRFFCRALCPLGACYALTTPFALFRMKLDTAKCVDCGACTKACPVELDVPREIGGPECIACGDCTKACPGQGLTRGIR